MTRLEQIHGKHIHRRRVRVLADAFSRLLPPDLSILDLGCGDGQLAALISTLRPDLKFTGVDVLKREQCAIPVVPFDGDSLPFADDTFDAVLLADVLHHTPDPSQLLVEALRVAKQWLAIKDHTRKGLLATTTLKFMDRLGNSRHGVALPHTYWSEAQWQQALDDLGLKMTQNIDPLPLYPWPASLVFTRKLHFCGIFSISVKLPE